MISHLGIGRAMAIAFAENSAGALLLAALEEDELKETERLVHDIQPDCRVYHSALDVTDEAKVSKFFEDAVAWAGGRLDVVCANAGIAPPLERIGDSNPSRWWLGLEVMLKGCYLFSRYAIPIMEKQKSGRIIFTSSIAAGLVEARNSSYQISKLAVTRLADCIDVEHQGSGVRAYAVHPGRIATQLLEAIEGGVESEKGGSKMPDRPAEHDDVSNLQNMCIFLCSDKSDFLSGCWVDGTRKGEDIYKEKELILEKGILKAEISVGWTAEHGKIALPRNLT